MELYCLVILVLNPLSVLYTKIQFSKYDIIAFQMRNMRHRKVNGLPKNAEFDSDGVVN